MGNRPLLSLHSTGTDHCDLRESKKTKRRIRQRLVTKFGKKWALSRTGILTAITSRLFPGIQQFQSILVGFTANRERLSTLDESRHKFNFITHATMDWIHSVHKKVIDINHPKKGITCLNPETTKKSVKKL